MFLNFLSLDRRLKSAVIALLFFVTLFSYTPQAFASTTDGSIDTANHYAWGENTGWVDFGTANGNVHITDSSLSGYAYGENIGWVVLDTVSNTSSGVLSGYAWGENVGWIDFSAVTIGADGVFAGNAYGENVGWITFGITNNIVSTDWRPLSVRASSNPNLTLTPSPRAHSSGGSSKLGFFSQTIVQPVASVIEAVKNIPSVVASVSNSITNIIPSFLKPASKLATPAEPPSVVVSKKAPSSMSATWNLLPAKAIGSFALAPLPAEIRSLAAKFPALGKTLKEVGVVKLSDMDKLNGVTLHVPGLSSRMEKILTNLGAGNIILADGVPTLKFMASEKKAIPSEFVFARTAGEKVDLDVALSVDDKGDVSQTISSLPGKVLRLVMKPLGSAKSVNGYFVFKAPSPHITQSQAPRSSFTASALFALNGLVENAPTPVPVEQKLVLSSFKYTDPDHDGIYTADIVTPVVAGEYDIITVIDYTDPALGRRQMRLTTVVDPEGYVFEKNGNKETRIPSATVSLYSQNESMGKLQLWPAKDYQQTNPQTTDVSGTYSFLVPEGSYYIAVEAPGYKPYQGTTFVVTEGSGVHQNIELQPNGSWFAVFDWRTVLSIVTFLLLAFGFVRLYKRT